jgi:phosphoserine/homoserine phosphotransferase
MPDQKRQSVAALKNLNYKVIAAGDSFNDTSMLGEADVGFLFHAPPNVIQQFPQFKPVESYPELMNSIKSALA